MNAQEPKPDKAENRVAHLGMIQLVIIRMAANSFLLKGWAVTLVAALFALASVDSRQEYALLALIPAFMFWGLDAYYLWQEKLFRELYDNVRVASSEALEMDAFTMDTRPYREGVPSLLNTARSGTLLAFYGVITLTVFAGIIFLAIHGGEEENHHGYP